MKMKTIEMIDTLTSTFFHPIFFTILVTYVKENYLNVRDQYVINETNSFCYVNLTIMYVLFVQTNL